MKCHRIMFDVWTNLPCHPDFTSATLRFLMKALESIYEQESLYIKNKINSEVSVDIL
jgi:hypothetical protein